MKDCKFIDKKDFEEAKRDLAAFEAKREEQIRNCRDTIQVSKKVIYAVHRNDMAEAKKQVKNIQSLIKKVSNKSYDTGMVSVAWQEYIEAVTYYEWVVNQKLLTRRNLGCTTHDYLLGLSDLSGELVRRAVTSASKGDISQAETIKEFLTELHWQFLQFDLRNNDLRRKADALKYHLLKVEDVLCDIAIKRAK